MADIDTALAQWSITASSNKPTDATAVGSGTGDNLRTLQAVVRGYLSHYNNVAIASAATTDLGAVTGLEQEVSGTAVITSFGTVSAGLWKIVRFQEAATLTHNAVSLILPGGATIVTAAGDHLLAYSKGSGNWVVPIYQRADGTPPAFITQLTAETAPDVADLIAIYDASVSANRKMTLENMFKAIGTLTTDASPDASNDYLVTFDTSTGASRKATLIAFPASTTVPGSLRFATAAETATGSSQVIGLTPAGFAANKNLVAATGHYTLPGNFVVNWGSAAYVGTGVFTYDQAVSTVLGYATFHQSSTSGASARITTISGTGVSIAADGMGGGSSTNGYIVLGIL